MDVKVKKLENEIREEFLFEKPRMVRQRAYDHINRLENYQHELVSLPPQLGPHIAKCSDQGSALQVVKCMMLITTMEGVDSLRTMMEDGMEPRMGGVTT